MNSTKHVVLLTSNIFGRGFDSRRLHHFPLFTKNPVVFAPTDIRRTQTRFTPTCCVPRLQVSLWMFKLAGQIAPANRARY